MGKGEALPQLFIIQYSLFIIFPCSSTFRDEPFIYNLAYLCLPDERIQKMYRALAEKAKQIKQIVT